jgi:hypothetical protein
MRTKMRNTKDEVNHSRKQSKRTAKRKIKKTLYFMRM